ncbi:MAG: hypothetical protein ACE5F1_19530, partial [Planctomycetota bacterium]
ACLAAVCLTARGEAQGHTRSLPEVYSGHYAPGVRALPFARTKGLVQYWYRGAELPPGIIKELGWRADDFTRASSQKQRLEITMDNSKLSFASLSKTFDDNLSLQALVFLRMKTLRLPAQNRPSDPDLPALWIKGDRPFVYRGPNLLIEVEILTELTPRSTAYFVDAMSMDYRSTLSSVSERSCGGRLVAGYDVSTSRFSLSLQGAGASSIAIFLLGTENAKLGGSIPLPLDLGFLGLEGCVLGLDPLAVAGLPTDGLGRAVLGIPFSLPAQSLVVHSQVVHRTQSKGLATTNVTHSILGSRGLCNMLYNWSRFSPEAQYGPYATNRSSILLWR